MSKYEPLWKYLKEKKKDNYELSKNCTCRKNGFVIDIIRFDNRKLF